MNKWTVENKLLLNVRIYCTVLDRAPKKLNINNNKIHIVESAMLDHKESFQKHFVYIWYMYSSRQTKFFMYHLANTKEFWIHS